jgi:hypothetical protein
VSDSPARQPATFAEALQAWLDGLGQRIDGVEYAGVHSIDGDYAQDAHVAYSGRDGVVRDASGVAAVAVPAVQRSIPFPARFDVELTAARYQLLLEAIEMSTGIDELAALRKEIRLAYAGDERVRHLDRLIDIQANVLMDEVGIDEGNDDTGVGPAPPETVRIWIDVDQADGPRALESFVARIRREWSAELSPALREAVGARRRELERAEESRS